MGHNGTGLMNSYAMEGILGDRDCGEPGVMTAKCDYSKRANQLLTRLATYTVGTVLAVLYLANS